MKLIESRIVQSANERPLKDLLSKTLQEVNELKKSFSSPASTYASSSTEYGNSGSNTNGIVSLAEIMKSQIADDTSGLEQQSGLRNQGKHSPLSRGRAALFVV